ncbi:hypothetical protein B5P44_00985 [Mycobacterium sp. CBMA 213]|uniref:Acyltransferase Chp1 n=1 Tax=Mycolicibacterium sp. CBMA 213 TaxID=1968788 RepID=A0A343VRI7_9MYCO|nr:acyltransferase Chp1 [Mycolicibacterium sp. CBMA 213]MUM03395.1 hypothetical protein [Mycolicibacterium sp. CBMA 213]
MLPHGALVWRCRDRAAAPLGAIVPMWTSTVGDVVRRLSTSGVLRLKRRLFRVIRSSQQRAFLSRTETTVGQFTPHFHRRTSGDTHRVDPNRPQVTAERQGSTSSRKRLHRSKFWSTVAAAIVAAVVAVTAFPAPAGAAVDAFYLPGTSPTPASSGIVGVSAIGAAADGWITQALQVGYPASLQPAEGSMPLDASVAQGVYNLAAVLAPVSKTDSILLFGVSQGDIVLTYEELALIAAGHPNNITFIRIADPSGPTGIMGRNAGLLLPGISCVLAPTDSPYNTVNVVHQYDVFADWPAQQLNLLADANAIAGGVLFHNYAAYDVDLSTLPASDITTTVNSLGATTTTYFIRDNGMLPLLVMMRSAGVPDTIVNALQPVLKPIVDSAYAPQPNSVFLAQKLFQAAVESTIAAATWTVAALRGTQATLTAAAARLTHVIPTLPAPAPAATAAARKAVTAMPTPVAGVKTPRPQATTAVAAGGGTAPGSGRQRTDHPGKGTAVTPTTGRHWTPVPVSSRKGQ